MSGTHTWSFGLHRALKWLCFFFSVIWRTHNVSQVQASSILHVMCPCCLSYGIGISKMLGSLLQLHQCLSWAFSVDSDPAIWCQAPISHLTITPSIPDLLLQPRLHFHQWPPTVSNLSFSPGPLHAFKTGTTQESLAHYQISLPAQVTAVAPLDHSFCVMALREHFPEDFTSVMLVLVTAHSSAPDDQHQLSQQSKYSTLVVLPSLPPPSLS